MPRDMSDSGADLGDLLDAALPIAPLADAAARERSAQQGLQILARAVRDVEAAPDLESAIRHLADLMVDASLTPLGDALILHRAEATQHLVVLRGRRGLAAAVQELRTLAEARASQDPGGLDALLRPLGLRGIRCPLGYALDEHGVRASDVPVAHYPIVVSALLRDVASGTTRLSLSWRRDRTWTTRTLPRDEALDARRVHRLALEGAPVTSSSAGDLVKYLAAFEAENLSRLPSVDCSSALGWVGSSLLVGETAYGPEGAARVLLDAPAAVAPLLAAHHQKGTWEDWCEIVRRVCAPHPLVMLGIYASVAAPLLERIGEPGFIVDWSDETSAGKSTTARLAASVWGDPSDSGILLSWASASMVGPIGAAAALRNLPLILDETKRGDPAVIAACLYDLPSGRERMRGTVDGTLRTPRTWRTVTLTTGEAQITSYSGDAGARARVICLQGAPLSAAWEARDIYDVVSQHYGHLGPRVARLVAGMSSERLRDRYREERAAISTGTGTEDRVAGRLLGYVAVLSLARRIAEHVGCPLAGDDPIRVATLAALSGGQDSDRPHEAWLATWSWAATRPTSFYGQSRAVTEPPTGWLGRWDEGATMPLMVEKNVLEAQLVRWEYDAKAVIASWHRRGWLLVDRDRRTRTVRIGGRKAHTYALLPR